ncbi:plasmid IncI1-type surface exclusion protein ExcA [Pantoea sp. DY-5]|uniref:plasmid IncI1-type surface exclusion protein ExcA n=1 Tax=Pantoea sp. DY-5 TaxID=2871488 RepID=UPI001C93D88D|nr:plasmid IncI1-type surface exclusion protein ExcA [Pantoea sp. DY-5]MBY4841251.1 plasmid IncI1-type surface exclusion protein ExcA [Pantoea sp. DY-5]
MKNVQRHDNSFDVMWALTKTVYYFIYLPCASIFAALTLFVFIGSSSKHSLFTTDYFLLLMLWLSILVPLGFRRFSINNRRRQLKKMVALLTSDERFSPQKQHQVLDAGRGKYLGIDTKHGTMLYIHMVKKGFVDVIGLTMDDWTGSEVEGSTLRIKTKNPDVPELSINAHQIVTRELFNTLSAMSHNSYSEPFPKEPWPLHVGIQSRFVEFEHNVVVPQAANLA